MTLKRLAHALAAAAAATLGVAADTASAADAPRPNVVHIVADDLGWKDVGFNGAADVRTPNIDKLAAEGVKLNQFYVQPMCTPTRACLMTGRYPFRYGLQTLVIPSVHKWGLPTDEWLLPQALKEAGYRTTIVGKWHLGHADQKYWPRQRGFDSQYGPLIGEIDYFTHEEHGVVDWYRDNQPLKEPGYSTTLIGNEAVKQIESHDAATPLYMYLAFNAPHTPYQAPPEYVERYKDVADPTRRTYCAMVTAMDEQVGRVVDALVRKNLRGNTLILFHSDNGGTRNAMFSGVMADVSKIKIPCDNGPYREGKGTLYEGGTRVCALANWPGRLKAGASDQMIHAVDLYPTIAALAGASTAKCKPLDGVDVWPALAEGKPGARTEVVYNIEPFRAAVRQGEFKLVWKSLIPESVELFNVSEDPSEAKNLAAENPDKVAALRKRANELGATAAKPLMLVTEFEAIRARLAMPPALPGQEFDLQEADIVAPPHP